MAYCKSCGAPISDYEVNCPKCGAPQNAVTEQDSGHFGWGILGFFFPVVGLVLFLVWKDTKPKTSKVAGIGALVGVVLSVVSSIFFTGLGILLALMSA